MKRVIVLGCGRVGAIMAKDLSKHPELEVTAADSRDEALAGLEEDQIKAKKADLSDTNAIRELVAGFDIAVGAVPGSMGFATMKAVIEEGVNYADISFMPENPLELDALAKERGVTAIVDCGVAPGISNMMVGYADSVLDETLRVSIMVGGLPAVRTLPYEYKAGFSPIDVIEEYTRPARFIRGGRMVTEPALSEVELVDFPGVGTLEAFNTDGLRTLMETIDAPDMREKTLRYPGHASKMRMLRDTGFFGTDEISVGSIRVKPRDVTTKLLFPMWELGRGEEELTAMRVTVEGIQDGKGMRYSYELLDRYDATTGWTSMARTTGFPNSIMTGLVATGKFARAGICPPEYIGRDHDVFRHVLGELEKRGVSISEKIEEI